MLDVILKGLEFIVPYFVGIFTGFFVCYLYDIKYKEKDKIYTKEDAALLAKVLLETEVKSYIEKELKDRQWST